MDVETTAYDSDEEFEHIYDSEYSISEDGLGTSSTGRWMGSLTSLRSTNFGSERAKLSSNVSVCSKAEKEAKVAHDDTGDFEIIDVIFVQSDEKQQGPCSKEEDNSISRSTESLIAKAKELQEKDFTAGSVLKQDIKSSKPGRKHDTSTTIDEEFVADVRKRHDISTSVDEDVLSEKETLEKNDTKEILEFDFESGASEAYVDIKDADFRLMQDNANESDKLRSEGDLHLLIPLQMESLTFEEHLVEDNVNTNVNNAGGREDRLASEDFIKNTAVANEEIAWKEESLVEGSGNGEIMTSLKQNAEGLPIENCKENQTEHKSKAARHSMSIEPKEQELKDTEEEFHLLKPLKMEALVGSEHFDMNASDIKENDSIFQEEGANTDAYTDNSEAQDDLVVWARKRSTEFTGNGRKGENCGKDSVFKICSENESASVSITEQLPMTDKSMEQESSGIEQDVQLLEPLNTEALVLNDHSGANTSDKAVEGKIFHEEKNVDEGCVERSEAEEVIAFGRRSFIESIGNERNEGNCDKGLVIKTYQENEPENVPVPEEYPETESSNGKEICETEGEWHHLEPLEMEPLILNERFHLNKTGIDVEDEMLQEKGVINEVCIDGIETQKELLVWCTESFPEPSNRERNENENDKGCVVKVYHENEPENVATIEQTSGIERPVEPGASETVKELQVLEPIKLGAVVLDDNFIENQGESECATTVDGASNHETSMVVEKFIDCTQGLDEEPAWKEERLAEGSGNGDDHVNDRIYEVNEHEVMDVVERNPHFEGSKEKGCVDFNQNLQRLQPTKMKILILEEHPLENFHETSVEKASDEDKSKASDEDNSMAIEAFIGNTVRLDEEISGWQGGLMDSDEMTEIKSIENKHFLDQEISNDISKTDSKGEEMTYEITCHAQRELFEEESIVVMESNIEEHENEAFEERGFNCTELVEESGHLQGEAIKNFEIRISPHTKESSTETAINDKLFIGNEDEMLENLVADGGKNKRLHENLVAVEQEDFHPEKFPQIEGSSIETAIDDRTFIGNEDELLENVVADGDKNKRPQENLVTVEEEDFNAEISPQTEGSSIETAIDDKPFIGDEDELLENVVADGDKSKRPHENLVAVEEEDFDAEILPQTEGSSIETAIDYKPFIGNEEELLENVVADGDENKRSDENLVTVGETFHAELLPQTEGASIEAAIGDKPFIENEDEMLEGLVVDRDENKRPYKDTLSAEEEEGFHAKLSTHAEESFNETVSDNKPFIGNEEELLENLIFDRDENKRLDEDLVTVEEEEDFHEEISPQTEESSSETTIDDKPFIGNEEQLLENVIADGEKSKRPHENLVAVEEEGFDTDKLLISNEEELLENAIAHKDENNRPEVNPVSTEEDFHAEISTQAEELSTETAIDDKPFIENEEELLENVILDSDESKRLYEDPATAQEEDFHEEMSPQTEASSIENAIADKSFIGNEEELLENAIAHKDENNRPEVNPVSTEEDFHAEISTQAEELSTETAIDDKPFIENEEELLENVILDSDESKKPDEDLATEEEEEDFHEQISPQTEESSTENAIDDKSFTGNDEEQLENAVADEDENNRVDINPVSTEEEEYFLSEISTWVEESSIETASDDKPFIDNEEEMLEKIAGKIENKSIDENIVPPKKAGFHPEILPETEEYSIDTATSDKPCIEIEEGLLENIVADRNETNEPDKNPVAIEGNEEEEGSTGEMMNQKEGSYIECATDDEPFFENEKESLEKIVADELENKKPDENLVSIEEKGEEGFHNEKSPQKERSYSETFIGDKPFIENEEEILEDVVTEEFEKRQNNAFAKKEVGSRSKILAEKEEYCIETVSNLGQNAKKGNINSAKAEDEDKQIKNKVFNDAATKEDLKKVIFAKKEWSGIGTTSDFVQGANEEDELLESVNNVHKHTRKDFACNSETERDLHQAVVAENKDSSITATVDFEQSAKEEDAVFANVSNEHKEVNNELDCNSVTGKDMHKTIITENEESSIGAIDDIEQIEDGDDDMSATVSNDRNRYTKYDLIRKSETKRNLQEDKSVEMEKLNSEITCELEQSANEEDSMFANVSNYNEEMKSEFIWNIGTEEDVHETIVAENTETEATADLVQGVTEDDSLYVIFRNDKHLQMKNEFAGKSETKEDLQVVRVVEKEESNSQIAVELPQCAKEETSVFANVSNEDPCATSVIQDLHDKTLTEKEESTIETTDDLEQNIRDDKSNGIVKFIGRSCQGLENVNSFKMHAGDVADKRLDENEALSNGIAKQTMEEDYRSEVQEKITKHPNEGLVDRKLHGEFYHELQERFHDEIRNVWICNGKGMQSTVYDAYSCQNKIEGTSNFDDELDLKREEAHVATDVNSLKRTSFELEEKHENISNVRGNKRDERIPSFVTWERKGVKCISSNEVQSWNDKGATMINIDLDPEGGKESMTGSEEHNQANCKENEQRVDRIANSLAEDESAEILRLLKEDLVWKTEDELSDYIVLGSPMEDKESNTTYREDVDIENKIISFVLENERPSSDPFCIEDEPSSVTKIKSSGKEALDKAAFELVAKENVRETEDYNITKSVTENEERKKSSEYEEEIANKDEDNISKVDDESFVYIDINSLETAESETTGQNIERDIKNGKFVYSTSKEGYEDPLDEQEEFMYHAERSACKDDDSLEGIVMETHAKACLEAEKGKGESGEESREIERENTVAEIKKVENFPMLRAGQQHASKNMNVTDDSLEVLRANPFDLAGHVINSNNIGPGATNDIKNESRDSQSHSFHSASYDVATDNGNKEIDLVESEKREMVQLGSPVNELLENLTRDKEGNKDTNSTGKDPRTKKEAAAEETSAISEGMGLLNNDASPNEIEELSHQENKEAVDLRTEKEVENLVKEDQKRQSRSLYEIGKDLLVRIFGGGDPGMIAPSTETSSGRTFDVGQSGSDDVGEEEFQTEIMTGKEDVDISVDFEQRVEEGDMDSESTSKEENEKHSEVSLAEEEMVKEKEALSVEAIVGFEQRHDQESDLLRSTAKEKEEQDRECNPVVEERRFHEETVTEEENLRMANVAYSKQPLDQGGGVLRRTSTEEEADGKCDHVEEEEEFNEEMVTQKKHLGMETTADSHQTIRKKNKVIEDTGIEEHEVKEQQIRNVVVEKDLHRGENSSLGFSTKFVKRIEMEEKVLEDTGMEGNEVRKEQVNRVEVVKNLLPEMIGRKEEEISLEVTAEFDKMIEKGNKVLLSASKKEQQGKDDTDFATFEEDFNKDKIVDVKAAAELDKFPIKEDKVLLQTDNQADFDNRIENACHRERQEVTVTVKEQERIGVDLEQHVETETNLSAKADMNKNDIRWKEDDILGRDEDLHTGTFSPEQDTSLELCGEDQSTKTFAEQHAIMGKNANTGNDLDMGEINLQGLIMKGMYRLEATHDVEQYPEAVGIRSHLKQSVEMMVDLSGKAESKTNDNRSEGVDLVGKEEELHRRAFATEQELSLEKCDEDHTKTFAQQYASVSKDECNGYDKYLSKETLTELIARTEPYLEATHDVGGHSKVEDEKVNSNGEEGNAVMSEDREVVLTEDDKDAAILVENGHALKFQQIAKIEERLMVSEVMDENNNTSNEIGGVNEEKDNLSIIFVDEEEKEIVLKCNESSSDPLSKDQEIMELLNDKDKALGAVAMRQAEETNETCKNYTERQFTSHFNKRTISISGESEINIRTKNICSNLQSLFFQVGSKAPEIAERSQKCESSKQSRSRPNSAESTQTSCSQGSEITDKHLDHNVLNDCSNKATIMKEPTLGELGNEKEDSTVSSRKSLDIELSSPSYATTVGKNLSLCFFDRHKQCFEEERHLEVSDATGKDAAGHESCLDGREGQVLNDGEGNGCISNVNVIVKKECACEEGQEYSTIIRGGVRRTRDVTTQGFIITKQSGGLFSRPKRIFSKEKSVQRTDFASEVAQTDIKVGSRGISGTVKETDQVVITVKTQPYVRSGNKVTEIGSIYLGK